MDGKKRIINLEEATEFSSSDYLVVDSQESGTRKIKESLFTDAIGAPLVASVVADMTDTSRVYVYTGSETGYTNGNWYYWNGSAWVSGGVYNAVAVVTDTTLSISGEPADAKATGDEIADLKSELHQTKTRNLFNPSATHITIANTAVSVNGNDVTITSINNANKYKYSEWFIDVRNKDSITVSFSEASGTGDVYVRLAWSNDGATHGDWFGYATSSPKTFDVTNYDYVGIALYAVLATNTGIGNFITYKNLMVEYGKNFSEYIPALVVNDQTAREIADYAKDQVNAVANLDPQALLDNAVWEVGGIDANGKNTSANNRIRTANYMRVPTTIDVVDLDIDTGYLYGFYFYDADFNKVFATTIFYSVPNIFSLPTNAVYCRAVMKNSTDSAGDVTWKTHLHCLGQSKLQNEVLNLVGGTGTNVYVGDEIHLATPKRTHNCDISLWLDVNSTDFPEVGTYRVYQNQSMAIYNGYVFVFFGNGGGIVIDCDTKTIINGFTSEPTGHNHQNSAQFTDIFYDENDDFPLIMISRCGNSSPNDPQTEYDTCLIYRITKSGTTFTFTLINAIDCDVASYGNDWVYDSVNRTISMITPKNGTYDVTENNPILFSTWEMPDATSILSETQITLLSKDRIGVAECGNVVLQSASAFGSDIFFGAQDGTTTRYVYVMDTVNGIIKTKIPLINRHELEGVTIYDGKLYVSHRNGSSLSETEPLQIYEITF